MAHRTALAFGLLIGAGLFAPPPASAQGAETDPVKRGAYLATAGDCVACHTAPGGKPFAGNYPLNTPIGVIMTPNLTPDKETGLGNWTEEDFEKSFRHGIGKDGKYLYPAFPFGWYTKVTSDDTKAIFAYLKSLPAVNEKKKDNGIDFPFNIRSALITWRTAFFKEGEFRPDPNASAEVNRGGYLVEGLGHCGMCHNENKLVGNSSLAGKLGGGVIDGWYAPNITPDDHQGIGAWTDEEVVSYLKTGTAPGNRPGVAAGPMRQTIDESLSKMTDADLKAIVAYLRSVPAKKTFKQQELQAYNQPGAPGGETYLTYCSSCHRPDGKGVEGAIPALAGNSSVQTKGPESVLRVIYGGLAAQNGYAPMPAIGQEMTEQQVKEVTDYVRNSWGNSAPVMNAGSAVSTAKEATKTMLAGTAPCAEIAPDKLKTAFDEAGVADALKGISQTDFVPRLSQIVPKVKAAATGASDDDIVNGLQAAFCRAGTAAGQQDKPGWTAILGSFGSVAYSQVRHPEKQASAKPGAPPASDMSAPSRN
ncbi:c-type cytochrome [Methylobacterium sp. WL9]|uniref:c-type cytochrome n=1 Tax=Methylobacterium sp. WL9 TaxID=2603898 RepID=UPI0011CB40F7|nr:c-type cytochrome [Methylobacterium sp. WL9]TXN25141.1 c-type cytochrome [Methylobacterium sp. WL9]